LHEPSVGFVLTDRMKEVNSRIETLVAKSGE
jgi:hypothetical protein